MKEIINHIIVKFLNYNGFDLADKKAVLLINEALDLYISSILKILNSHTFHSRKQCANIWDFVSLLNFKNLKIENNIKPVLYPSVQKNNIEEFKSPLSTYLERYIHIYDFMPSFPPTHTFRQTYIKNKEKEDRSQKVKTRLEQSLRAEKNLLRLIKGSGSLPSFVNYLHKK